jgi:hypothetical protein
MALLVAWLISSGGEYLFHLLLASLEDPKLLLVSLSGLEGESLGVWVVLEAVWVLGLVPVYSEVRRNSGEVRV